MSVPFFLCLIGCVGFAVSIPWAVRNDNLDALENLDDEELAGMVADEWNQEVKA